MNALTPPIDLRPATLSVVIKRLSQNTVLSATRKRDLISAVNTAARLLNRKPMELLADVRELRSALLQISPRLHRMSPKRFANVKSDLGHALLLTGAISRGRPKRPANDAWIAFLGHADARHQAWSLSRFVQFCTGRRIDPSDVDDRVMEAFHNHLDATILTKSPKDICKEMAQTWNVIVTRKGLNFARLTVPHSSRYRAAPLAEYPASLQADIARYMDRLKHTQLFDEEGPVKPLKPTSLRNIEAHLRQFLDVAISCGRNPDQFLGLADVVAPEVIKVTFRAITDRNGGKMPVGLQNMAGTMLAIARHYVKSSASELAVIKGIKKRTFMDLSGMSEKNKARLSQFDDWRHLATLISLPDVLIKRAQNGPRSSRSALDAMHAVAIAILLACPMRVKNLAGLDIDANIRVMSGKGKNRRYVVSVAGDSVKNGTQIDIQLGKRASALLGIYLDTYRYLVSDQPGTALFPQRSGGPRKPGSFGQHLQNVILRETGLTVHPHLFRHLCAKLYLEAHPGDYETVRRLLGHKKLDTTLSFYAQFDNRLAHERFADVVLAAKRPRVRR